MARWVRVLEAFADSGEWGIRDLARATDIPRSAAHRILHDMAALGLLAPADEPGRFRVGADLARIGLLVAEHLDIRREGRPFLERALGGDRRDRRHRRLRPRPPPVLGGRRRRDEPPDPLPVGIAAGLERPPPRLVRQGHPRLPAARRAGAILDRLPDPVPGRNAVTKAGCARSSRRRAGAASSSATASATRVRSGSSAPVRDARGRVVGDLIATWPDNRTDEAKEAAAGFVVRTAADDLSRRLGWAGPPGDAT